MKYQNSNNGKQKDLIRADSYLEYYSSASNLMAQP